MTTLLQALPRIAQSNFGIFLMEALAWPLTSLSTWSNYKDTGQSKLYIPSILNIDFILWHPQLIVDAITCLNQEFIRKG